MGRRPTPEHVAMRDQILALLRDRSVMTTVEIGEALQRPSVWHGMEPEAVAAMHAMGLPIKTMRRTWYWEVYPQLAAMARLGIIQRVGEGHHPLAWMLVSTGEDC